MAEATPGVLLLATDWPINAYAGPETLYVNQRLGRELSARGARVYCTVPHFGFENEFKNKQHHAQNHANPVNLIPATHRAGRKETPDSTWITDYWRQYYHEAVRVRDNFTTNFSHVIAYVPDTYHAALDIAEEYYEDAKVKLHVTLIVTDTEPTDYCIKDAEILKADKVCVLGPVLFSKYRDITDQGNGESRPVKLMPIAPKSREITSDSVAETSAFLDTERDIKIITMWPAYVHTNSQQELEGFGTIVKAIRFYTKHMYDKRKQKVHWEVGGVSEGMLDTIRNLVQSEYTCTDQEGHVDVNCHGGGVTSRYSLYVSPLRHNPCDIHCLRALQNGIPALLYAQSGVGEYLQSRSDELGNHLVETVLIHKEREWPGAFDMLTTEEGARRTLQHARDLASRLSPDKSWCSLLSCIVPDAIVCSPGTAYVAPSDPLPPPDTQLATQKPAISPLTLSGDSRIGSGSSGSGSFGRQWSLPSPLSQHPVNPEVILDQSMSLEKLSIQREEMESRRASGDFVLTRKWQEVFSERYLSELGRKLCGEMQALGLQLGLQKHDIERHLADNPHNASTAVTNMLIAYKNSSPLYKTEAQTKELIRALVAVNRYDLAEEIAGAQPSNRPPSNPVPGNQNSDRRDLTQCRVTLVTPRSRRKLQEDPTVYKTRNTAPHGYAIIVNINSIERLPGERDGSSVDVAMVKNLFYQLHYDVRIIQDVTADELMFELRKITSKSLILRDHTSLVAFLMSHGQKGEKFLFKVVFLMSHGQKDTIWCKDRPVKLDDVFRLFGECRALDDKPKMFVIQACRTESLNTTASDGMDIDAAVNYSLPSYDSMLKENKPEDFLLAYSTCDGQKSFRDTQLGSWYIRALVETFSAQAHALDVAAMLTQVNRKITEKAKDPQLDTKTGRFYKPKQCSEIQSRLSKTFYLLP